MLKAFPSTTVRANPYILSKVHVWKKNYGSISGMRTLSGFEWVDSTCTIEVCYDATWNDYVKGDSNAKHLRFKTFPFYKDWCDIFGKDRATGEEAEDYVEVDQELNGNDNGQPANPEGDYVPDMSFGTGEHEAETMSVN